MTWRFAQNRADWRWLVHAGSGDWRELTAAGFDYQKRSKKKCKRRGEHRAFSPYPRPQIREASSMSTLWLSVRLRLILRDPPPYTFPLVSLFNGVDKAAKANLLVIFAFVIMAHLVIRVGFNNSFVFGPLANRTPAFFSRGLNAFRRGVYSSVILANE